MKQKFPKPIIVLLILYSVSFFSALNSCKKSETYEKYFDIRKMRVYGIDITNIGHHDPQNIYNIDYSNYRLTLDFTDSIFYYSHTTRINYFPLSINSAYASLWGDGYLGSKEIISAIYITSDADYDSLHLAGDTLNDLFNVNNSLNEINFIAQEYIKLSLTKKPELNSTHTFTVSYYQTNGEYYSGKTKVSFN